MAGVVACVKQSLDSSLTAVMYWPLLMFTNLGIITIRSFPTAVELALMFVERTVSGTHERAEGLRPPGHCHIALLSG